MGGPAARPMVCLVRNVSRVPLADGIAGGRPVHGTFLTDLPTAALIPRIAADGGFNVVYLPPIHPIGTLHRGYATMPSPPNLGRRFAWRSAARRRDTMRFTPTLER